MPPLSIALQLLTTAMRLKEKVNTMGYSSLNRRGPVPGPASLRWVLSRFTALVALLAFGMTLATPQAAQAQANPPIGIYNIIQSVDIVNGKLVATTTQGQTLPIDLHVVHKNADKKDKGSSSSARSHNSNACDILALELGPINLNLLGLQVDTSEICLFVTGERGGGNLLGNLLCSITGLLDGGTPLADILAGLTANQRLTLLSGILNILNGALNNLNQAVVTGFQAPGQQAATGVGASSSAALCATSKKAAAAAAAAAADCAILNLALGPLDLNLLGLRVQLNNCDTPAGPVTVDVTAAPGGGLLGDLLCGLLNPGGFLANFLANVIGDTLQQVIADLFGGLLP